MMRNKEEFIIRRSLDLIKFFSTKELIDELVERGARVESGENFEIVTEDLNAENIVRYYKSIMILDGLLDENKKVL